MKACCKEYLEKQFKGNEGIVEEIYKEYRTAMGEKFGEIVETVGRREWEALDRLAHTVKGNALLVGDTETADVAIELRGASKAADVAKAEDCIERLRGLVAAI